MADAFRGVPLCNLYFYFFKLYFLFLKIEATLRDFEKLEFGEDGTSMQLALIELHKLHNIL